MSVKFPQKEGWKPIPFDHEETLLINPRKDEIFDFCQRIVTRVESYSSRSTGFFLKIHNHELFFAASHSLEDRAEIYVNEYDRGEIVAQVNDVCMLHVFTQKPLESLMPPLPVIPTIEENYKIPVGTAVYFTGFPYAQNNLSFHKGYVSSVIGDMFSIDGTVVAGHSGSPVFALHKESKKLFLIGMITSEGISSLKELQKLDADEDESVKKVHETYRKYISTGIGWAVNIRACKREIASRAIPFCVNEREQADNLLQTAFKLSGSYMDGKNKVEFTITGRELTKGGHGPRTLLVSVDGRANTKFKYKINNPHKSSYNNFQEKFYMAAAENFVTNYNGNPPETITFNFDGKEFTGTLS